MGIFKPRTNYRPHNFNSFTVIVNGETQVEGLNSFSCERNEDEITMAIAADGTGLPQENPNISGIITLEIQEPSPTNGVFWGLQKEGAYITISAVDSNDTSFNCSMASGRVKKPPVLNKGLEVSMVEWVFEAVYLDLESGGYSIIDAA